MPLVGAVESTGDPCRPCRLVDAGGAPIAAVSAFFDELQAAGRSASTLRSYGMDLLRWFRFIWAIDVDWNRATRVDTRDFARWMLVAGKPCARKTSHAAPRSDTPISTSWAATASQRWNKQRACGPYATQTLQPWRMTKPPLGFRVDVVPLSFGMKALIGSPAAGREGRVGRSDDHAFTDGWQSRLL